jgi:hypothetical protein
VQRLLNQVPINNIIIMIYGSFGLKIVRYQNFTKRHNQTQKRKEKKRKEIKKEEDVEDELAHFYLNTVTPCF